MYMYRFQARVKDTHALDCERIAILVEEGKKKEAERLTKAKVEVVVATKRGAICQRRTYRFEDTVHQFFRRLQSVMEVDMLEAEAAILIYVDGEKIEDWDGTIMGDIIDVDSTFMIALSDETFCENNSIRSLRMTCVKITERAAEPP